MTKWKLAINVDRNCKQQLMPTEIKRGLYYQNPKWIIVLKFYWELNSSYQREILIKAPHKNSLNGYESV